MHSLVYACTFGFSEVRFDSSYSELFCFLLLEVLFCIWDHAGNRIAKLKHKYIGGTSTAHGGKNKTSEILVSAICEKASSTDKWNQVSHAGAADLDYSSPTPLPYLFRSGESLFLARRPRSLSLTNTACRAPHSGIWL